MCKKILSISLLLIWMAGIFMFSAQPANDSNEVSDQVEEIIITFIKKVFPSLQNADRASFDGIISLTTLVRKCAHLFLYFVLGIILLFVCYTFKGRGRIREWCLSFACLYAISDEVHQLFVKGRAGRLIDVVIDTLGAALGILLVYAILFVRKAKSSKK